MDDGGGGGGDGDKRIPYRLANTFHSEATHSLPFLPNLPTAFGADKPGISVFENEGARAARGVAIMAKAGKIAELLATTDVSYISLKDKTASSSPIQVEPGSLAATVLNMRSDAFDCHSSGEPSTAGNTQVPETLASPAPSMEAEAVSHKESRAAEEHIHGRVKRQRLKRKSKDENCEKTTDTGGRTKADVVSRLCELLDEYLDRTDHADHDGDDGEDEGPILSLQDIRSISEEVGTLYKKAALNKVPPMQLLRLLDLLDHHIRLAHLKEIDDNDDMESENFEIVMTALESAHITLMIMSSPKMPKQIYKEEHIDRLIEFTRYQIVHSVFTAYDPLYRQIHKNVPAEDDEGDDEEDEETGKRQRRKSRGKTKKLASKVSTAVTNVLHKLCNLLGLLKDLLSVERLVDSIILQLMKTVLGTFGVDNIQLLQLKAIGVACTVFSLYPQHQIAIMEEVLSMFWKLPTSKRCIRTYHLPDEEAKQIHMLTALLLHLIQSSVCLPSLPKLTSGDLVEEKKSALDAKKCFERAGFLGNFFWRNVLQRWAVPKSQDGSDIKAVVENISTDLLNTINVPELPAASLLLQTLCVLLLDNDGMKSRDVAVRVNAIELLGQIAASLKRDAVICHQERLWLLQELQEGSHDKSKSKDTCTVCGTSKGNKHALRCDGCKRLFHGDCVGVTGQDQLGRGWLCQCCLCKKQLASFNSSSKDKDLKLLGPFKVPKAGLAVLQQILLNFLRETGSGDSLSFFTRRFYLCLWYRYDPQEIASLPFYHWRSEHDFGITSSLPRDSIVRITRALGQHKVLQRGFDRILERLLGSLSENAPNPRAKALKAVSGIVEVDPGFLADERVQNAVEGRFLDSSISVREAAMELVGRHIVSRPDVAIKYFDRLSERIMDTGVSVRKRVIKIIRDFCLSKACFPKATEARVRVINRINDEETSIQDLVCKTFYEMWFEEVPGQQAPSIGDGSIVPTDVAERAQQLVDVLKHLSSPSSPTGPQSLVMIIRRSLALDFIPQTSKSAPPSIISQAAVRNRCELMCTYLMECILKADEASDDSEIQALPYVSALYAFCMVDPTLCAPSADPSRFAVTLQPYLKTQGDSRETSQLLQSIVHVIDTVLPLLRRPLQSFVDELQRDLRQLITRCAFMNVVQACVKCFCSLANIAPRGVAELASTVRQFYKVLEAANQDNGTILRSIFCLGMFVRYGADLIDVMDDPEVTMKGILTLFKRNIFREETDFKCRALQAIGCVFLARPQYMLEEDMRMITAESIASQADSRIKGLSLKNFLDYLVEAEKQMGADEAGEKKDSSNAVPIAAGAGDNNICGGIIQLHWERILERCLDTDGSVRQHALKVVEAVLRQGLVHPLTCVPHLIALEVDLVDNNWKLAHRLLTHMNEKYPSFFESRLGDGLQMSFQFIQSGAANSVRDKDQNEATFARGGISRAYKLIRSGRNSRNKFISSVVRKFDWVASGHSSIPFLIYCTEILTSLPFSLADEPLYLIYAINRVLQVRAGDLEASMKAEVTQIKKRDPAEDVPEDQILKLQTQSDCAVGLSLLLKMKRHLKICFTLDDTRCQAYQPSEAVKTSEVVSRQASSKEFNSSDLHLDQPQNMMQIVQRYQQFKNLLKEDTMDYASYAPPASTKKRNRLSGADGLYQGHGHAGGRMRRKSAPAATEDGSDNDNEGDGDGDEDYGGVPPPSKRRKTSTPGASRSRSRKQLAL